MHFKSKGRAHTLRDDRSLGPAECLQAFAAGKLLVFIMDCFPLTIISESAPATAFVLIIADCPKLSFFMLPGDSIFDVS